MYTWIPWHGLKRSWRSCPRRVNAGNKNTPSLHQNVTTSMVGLKSGHIRKNLTQNGEPRDVAGNAEEEEEAMGFFRVESYQWLKNRHSSGYPARRLALRGQYRDWLARCQYIVTGWDGKFDLQLLSQCGSTYNCLSTSVPWDTLACCSDVRQPSNKQNHSLSAAVSYTVTGWDGKLDLKLLSQCGST